ncbi:PAC2 family protein [Microbacterium karelineae]|uniref:PAC2 family protein n=1 Tax=Microbacterium karelineae TaxID=2654283 RepID=UPI0012EA2EF9|nr:PAC2 family protein [Microbacterium karelineae]
MDDSTQQALGPRVAVAAFDGWNDAGEAASQAVGVLRDAQPSIEIVSVDPELFFDYQYTRPTLRLDGEGRRALDWPEATLHRPMDPRGFWTLRGVEPARAWRSFTAEFIDALLAEDVTGLVTVGAMMSDVPHTRPIAVHATSENELLRNQLEIDRSRYEGPTGILGVLTDAAETAGIPTVALWASVPHYVAGASPSPKATLALLERLGEMTAREIELGSLPTEAATWEATVDAAAADDDEMSDYIRQLEEARDTWDSPEASGDAIAQAFEKYLRGDGPGKGRPPRG